VKRSRRVVAVIAAALFALASCGSQSTAELDTDELTEVLVDAGLDQAQAECAAEALVDADLTLEEVESLAAGEDTDDAEKAQTVTEALQGCTTDGGS
jgi:pyruvate-formate lyase